MKELLRKFTVLILSLTIFVSTASVCLADGPTDGYIKVGLKYGSGAPSSVTVSSDKGLVLCTADGSSISKASGLLDGYSSVIMKLSGSSVQLTDASGSSIGTMAAGGSQCIASAGIFSSDEPVAYDGTKYRGGIMPYINSSGQMNIINYVNIEDYLRGVLPSEMSASYGSEALKAQAVTARSFVDANKSTHASQGFSVCATTHCQTYGGVSRESSSTDAAVEATEGLMMYYDGSPVAGYYFTNSGGHTENSEDVWVSALGYCRGKADPYSPDYPWTVRLTRAEIFSALSAQGIGSIESITIDSVNDSGYVASVTVNGSRKSITKTKDSIRSLFGSGSLKSRLFTISTEGGTLTQGSSTTIPASGSWYARGSAGTSLLGQNITVVNSKGTVSSQLNGSHVLGADGSTGIISYTPASVVSSGAGTTVTFNSDSDVLIISGNGFGHGVGMSQAGAQEMAKQGFSYKDILAFYYTGIEIK